MERRLSIQNFSIIRQLQKRVKILLGLDGEEALNSKF
jgi:hypothetical protein